jgi:hypothetical protein
MTGTTVFPVLDHNFCLFFRPDPGCPHRTLNVLPDFLPPHAVEIASITIDGVKRTSFAKDNFQIELEKEEMGSQVIVEFYPRGEQP